jgi:methionyl aminopeptidase
MICYKSQREIDLMLHAGQVLVRLFERAEPLLKPGVTTKKIDRTLHGWMLEAGCTPSFLGYRGFPAVSCISVNEEVVHGIPGPRALEEGDLVTLDLGVIWKGYHADAARTYAVGRVDELSARLMEVTRKALDLAIQQIGPGARLSAIGGAVQGYAESAGFSVVRDFVGHGIGREMHEDPQVQNYIDEKTLRRDVVMRPGLVIAVEPMVNAGSEAVEVLSDGWTVVTKDGARSAHFEDTVAVTAAGPVVLTRYVEPGVLKV